MKRITAFLIIVCTIILTACATPPTTAAPQPAAGGYDPAAYATITARQAEDGRATLEAVQQATAVSVQQTTTAVEQATSTAVSAVTGTAVAVTGTAESVAIRVTEVEIAANQTRHSIEFAGTATRQVMIVSGEMTAEAEHIVNVQQLRADKVQQLDNARAREAMWNWLIPALVAVLILIVVCVLVYAGLYFWRSRRPVVHVTYDNRTIPLIFDGNGGYQMLASPVTAVSNDLLQLPAPSVQAEILPPLEGGHVLIAGPSGSGKTTAMQAILQSRHDIVVLDPHAAPGDWGNAQVKGAGRNYDEIAGFMQWMLEELNRRAQARAEGQTVFPEMTVATDEMPSIATELGKETYSIWQKWVREGRKYGLYFVVSTQSTRVKTMGIQGEGDVLSNFVAAILLGSEAVSQCPDLVTGMERPAVIRTLQGTRPVIIPHSPTDTAVTDIQPIVNMPNSRPVSQAEQDAESLAIYLSNGRITSLNDAGRVLDGYEPEDRGNYRPSGQLLRERVRPALAWRINYLNCEPSSQILTGK